LRPVAPDRFVERSSKMDFIKSMQPRDWMIAAVAFIVGAIIF
jgi:hypothetical protein